MRPIGVVLHCTATSDDEAGDVSIETVDKWHRARKFRKVGYQYLIRRDGTIEKGREETEWGAHTIGQNDKRIGVAYSGTDSPTIYQIESITTLQGGFRRRWGITPDDWDPHRKYANKECPGFGIELVRYMLWLDENLQLALQR